MSAAFGTAYPAANGYAGQAVVEASRLLAWEPLKRVFDKAPDVDLALILSHRVFEDTVRQGHTSHSVREFREVRVLEKEYDAPAWVWVPGLVPTDLDFLEGSTSDDSTSDDSTDKSLENRTNTEAPNSVPSAVWQRAEAITNLYGPVDARRSVFGVNRNG
ncbi:hypothetical protein [Thermocatellispora tengchongensis]|uniref:hypothetical protein n=1 Tax=Thermocatellispora tengchongensis TaxID=1073253 RepID=UPI0036326A5A